jgi:hypothetical protein
MLATSPCPAAAPSAVVFCCVSLFCSGIEVQPHSFAGSDGLSLETSTLFGVINEARVHKTPGEIALMKYVNHLGSRAHVAMMQVGA